MESSGDARGLDLFRIRTYKAFLRELDWEIENGSTKWSDPATSAAAFENFRTSGRALIISDREKSKIDSEVREYSPQEINQMPRDLLKALGENRASRCIQSFLEIGSNYLSEKTLATLGYEREREMAAQRANLNSNASLTSYPRLASASVPTARQAALGLTKGFENVENAARNGIIASHDEKTLEDKDLALNPTNSAPHLTHTQSIRKSDTGRKPFERKREYVTEARRMVCKHIDKHHVGRSDGTASRSEVARTIAISYELFYYDRLKRQKLRRNECKVLDVMREIVRRYNRWTGMKKLTLMNLLEMGSKMNVDDFEDNWSGTRLTSSRTAFRESEEPLRAVSAQVEADMEDEDLDAEEKDDEELASNLQEDLDDEGQVYPEDNTDGEEVTHETPSSLNFSKLESLIISMPTERTPDAQSNCNCVSDSEQRSMSSDLESGSEGLTFGPAACLDLGGGVLDAIGAQSIVESRASPSSVGLASERQRSRAHQLNLSSNSPKSYPRKRQLSVTDRPGCKRPRVLCNEAKQMDVTPGILRSGSEKPSTLCNDGPAHKYSRLLRSTKALDLPSEKTRASLESGIAFQDEGTRGQRNLRMCSNTEQATETRIPVSLTPRAVFADAPGARVRQTMPTATIYADSTEFFLSDRDLRRRVQSLAFTVASVVHGLIRDMGVAGGKTAVLVAEPSTSLRKAYCALFGGSDLRVIRQESLAEGLTDSELAVALAGVAVWKHVFRGSATLPLSFGRFYGAQRQSLGSHFRGFEEQLKPFGTNSDALFRRTYLDWITDSEARRAEMGPVVDLLKHKVASVLLEHLQGSDDNCDEDENKKHIALVKAFADPVEEMVMLTCQVSCAREEYSFHWPVARSPLDARTMEILEGAGETVATAMFPGLCKAKDGREETVAKARVKSLSSRKRWQSQQED